MGSNAVEDGTADAAENVTTKVLEGFEKLDVVLAIISRVEEICKDQIALEKDLEDLTFIIDEYQEQPHLLDPYLENLVSKLLTVVRKTDVPIEAFHQCFKYLYLLAKLRGYKKIIRHFSHEVSDLEPVLSLLTAQKPTDHQTWETRYVLLLWLSMITIIPFDLSRLDGDNQACATEKRLPIVERLLSTTRPYLADFAKTKDAAAFFIARFVTRPDVKESKLGEFVDWSVKAMHDTVGKTMEGMNTLTGILATLGLIFKHGKRDDVLPYAASIMSQLEQSDILDLNNTLLRKLTVKLVQRLGLTFLKPRVASWRYQRGSRSLASNLGSSCQDNQPTPEAGHSLSSQEEEEDFDIPEEVEVVLEMMLNGLRDKDTIVRWSAAKGVGRMTGRLPKELADEVVGSLLELFTLGETDGAWHGGCLALAELGRRGLLLPSRLPEVVPIILKALQYDERRGSSSVGAHVRDAACYVCWSFARAYDPDQMKLYVNQIASALIITTVFDREVNCRRAASAAFQENVGRQGTFPHGIDILTAADYFAVGNRKNCYCNLSDYIAGFKEYTRPLIDHLHQVKITHWDCVIRDLTSLALHKLTAKDPDYMVDKVIPSLLKSAASIDLHTRHGAIVSLAEIIHALFEHKRKDGSDTRIEDIIGSNVVEDIKKIVSRLMKAKQFRGFGGEYMRLAVCKLIEKLSLSKIPYHNSQVLEDWIEIIDDTLPHTEPHIQACASTALTPFCTEYYSDSSMKETRNELVSKYCSKLKSEIRFDRMGFCQGLGALPRFILVDNIDQIFQNLIECTIVDADKAMAGVYADSRRDAVLALSQITSTVGLEGDDCLKQTHVDDLYSCYFEAMLDYTVDSRGDVGAWLRTATMSGLESLTMLLCNKKVSYLSEDRVHKVMCHLAQQAAEKIDKTRSTAGIAFIKLLHSSDPLVPHIREKEALCKLLPKTILDQETSWSIPAESFSQITPLLSLDSYRYSVLLGLTVTVGGLTESLVRESSDALLTYLADIQDSQEDMDKFLTSILSIFEKHVKSDRVILPLLKVIDLLLSSGSFDVYVLSENSDIMKNLFTCIKKEILKCGDAKKLLASVKVFCGLIQFEPIRKVSLSQLMIFLCHKYPRVRKATAEQMYTTLLTFDDLLEETVSEGVMSILTDVNWDDAIEDIRPRRNELCAMLNVAVPVMKQGASKSQVSTERKVDELDSYKDLVSRHF